MGQNIAEYIKFIGQDKIKGNLKEKITQAISTEDWQLVKEITELIEQVFNSDRQISKQELTRCVEIIGVDRFNSNLKDELILAIESEEWVRVKEISLILHNCSDCDRQTETTNVKNLLKIILKKSIEEENWCLAEQITNTLKNNYPSHSGYIIEQQDTKIQLKKALKELIQANKYDFTNEIVSVIQANLVEYAREVEILKQETEALQEAQQLYSPAVHAKYPVTTVERHNQRSFNCDRVSETIMTVAVDVVSCENREYNQLTVAVEAELEIDASDDVLETMEDLHNVVISHLDEQ